MNNANDAPMDAVGRSLIGSIESLGYTVSTNKTIAADDSAALVFFSAMAEGWRHTHTVRGPRLNEVLAELAEKCGVELADG